MQRRRACICDHGTGGGGTLSPPVGTATHRYIFPTAFSAVSVHSCHLGIKRWCYVPFGCWVGGLTCQVAERYLRVILKAAVYASLPPLTAASLIRQSTFFHSRHQLLQWWAYITAAVFFRRRRSSTASLSSSSSPSPHPPPPLLVVARALLLLMFVFNDEAAAAAAVVLPRRCIVDTFETTQHTAKRMNIA